MFKKAFAELFSSPLPEMTLAGLAHTFNEATVRKVGTDEDKMFSVLAELNRREKQNPKIKDRFVQAVLLDLGTSGIKDKKIKELIKQGNGNIIPGIFRDEFSPIFSRADLSKAYRLWQGKSDVRDNLADSALAGVGDAFDLSSTKSKLVAGGLVSISVAFPPAGVAILCGGALFGAGKALDGAVKFAQAKNTKQEKRAVRSMGQGFGMVGGAALGARGFKTFNRTPSRVTNIEVVSSRPLSSKVKPGEVIWEDPSFKGSLPSFQTPRNASPNNNPMVMKSSSSSSTGANGVSVETPSVFQVVPRSSSASPRQPSPTRLHDSQNEAGIWKKPPQIFAEMRIQQNRLPNPAIIQDFPGMPGEKEEKIENPLPPVYVPLDGYRTDIDFDQPIGDRSIQDLQIDPGMGSAEPMEMMGLGDWFKKKDDKDGDKLVDEAIAKIFDDPSNTSLQPVRSFLKETFKFFIEKKKENINSDMLVDAFKKIASVADLLQQIYDYPGLDHSLMMSVLLGKYNSPQKFNQLGAAVLQDGAMTLQVETDLATGEIKDFDFVSIHESDRAKQREWINERREELRINHLIGKLTQDFFDKINLQNAEVENYLSGLIQSFLIASFPNVKAGEGTSIEEAIEGCLSVLLNIAIATDKIFEDEISGLSFEIVLAVLLNTIPDLDGLLVLREALLEGEAMLNVVDATEDQLNVRVSRVAPESVPIQKRWIKDRMKQLGLSDLNIIGVDKNKWAK